MTIMHSRKLHYGYQILYTFRGRSRVAGLKMRRVLRVDKNATTISFLLLTTLCYNCGVIEGTHEPRGNITWAIAALIVRQLTAPSPAGPRHSQLRLGIIIDPALICVRTSSSTLECNST